jgi:peptide/nickel transport system substrate-binding protein
MTPVSAQAASPEPTAEETTLRIGTLNEPNTASILVCCVVWLEQTLGFDQLVGKDIAGNPVPTFAESWTASDDVKTWTFKIRPGMKWSDGEPADADDAAFTLNYYKGSAASTNPLFSSLTDIMVSATATDPLTLVLELKDPSTLPLTDRMYILPEHIWKDVKYEDIPTFQAEPPIVGTGPFILTKWVHGQYQEYTRNDNYWGDKPAVSKILIQFYKSTDATVAALKAGEIDFTDAVNIAATDQLVTEPSVTVIDAPFTHLAFLKLNGKKAGPPYAGAPDGPGGSSTALADPAFREAIRYAIDNQKLVEFAVAGHGQPGVGPLSPSDTANYTGLPDIAAHFDPELAKQKLDAAGYTDSNGDGTREDKEGKELVFELLVDQWDPMFTPTAQYISEWLALVGVKATPTVDPTGNRQYNNDYDLTVTGGLAGILNRYEYFGGPYDTTDEPEVRAGIDELKATLYATVDPAARKDLIAQWDREVFTTSGSQVLFYPNLIQAYRTDRFTGWDVLGANMPLIDIDLYSVPTFTALTPVSAAVPSGSAEASAEAPASAAPSGAPGPTDTTGGSSTLPIVIGAGIVAVVIGAIVVRRRKNAA